MMGLRQKRVLVVGLARSGRAVAQRLRAAGATVTVTDTREPAAFQDSLRELLQEKIGLELGLHREETFLRQDLIVVSPGVSWDMPYLLKARRQQIRVLPEVEAASWFLPGPLVGITGSNGKTTTTALLGKMLECARLPNFVGGNIGVPLITAAGQVTEQTIVVAELSSFQLEAIQDLRPHVAVLLNITPNHLDRHPSFEAYISAKAQIFRNQRENNYAILNADDPVVMSLAPSIASRTLYFSLERDLPEGVMLSRGRVLLRWANLERVLLETREIKLRGDFNVQNVMAAAAAAFALGADFSAIRQAVREFTGVEHRLEYVATLAGVEFFNDSKATSVDATAKALSAFQRGVHLIMGGKDKGAPYAPLRPLIETRVKNLLLIGAAAQRIGEDLSGASEIVMAGDLAKATREAFARAVPGDTVLLAPACSSFDQFQDFEQRGRVFKELVAALAQAQTANSSQTEPQGRRTSTATQPGPAAAPPRQQVARGPQLGGPETSQPARQIEDQINQPQVKPESDPVTVAGVMPGSQTKAKPLEPVFLFELQGEESGLLPVMASRLWEGAGESAAGIQLRPFEPITDQIIQYEVGWGAEAVQADQIEASAQAPAAAGLKE
jgi:UDP-N-acetylmuramoylalanine--D-glutamate ligase